MAYPKDNSLASAYQSGDLLWFSRATLDMVVDADNILNHLDTDSLTEGAVNKYFTDERVDDRTAALIQNGTGISWSYNDGAGTLTPTVTLSPFDTEDLAEGNIAKYVSYSATSTLDNAAILALNSAPQVIALGIAGRSIMFLGAILRSLNQISGYTNSGLEIIDSVSGSVLAAAPSTSISHTSTQIWHFAALSTGVQIGVENNLLIRATSADPTGGNVANTLKVHLIYRVIDL
jgi:hypothetical protein